MAQRSISQVLDDQPGEHCPAQPLAAPRRGAAALDRARQTPRLLLKY